jgi:hypothetical protein
MLSRAQEARVREVLGSHPPGTPPTYCLEHLAVRTQIPVAHLADLAAFVPNLRTYGACQTRYGGVCDAGRHQLGTADPDSDTGCAGPRMKPLLRWIRRWFQRGGREVAGGLPS